MELLNPTPKTNLYDIRNKLSTPIKIPTRRRQIAPWNGSPPGRPMSPDLIFEMSPVSSAIHSPSRHGAGFTDPSQNLDSQEPFMYSFPKFSAHRNYMHSTRRSQGLQNTIFPSPFAGSPAITKHSSPRPILAPSLTSSSTTITKKSSITKITGFTPVTPISTQAYSPIRGLKMKRLSPPPRSSSYSSSPWILPGKSDAQDDESGSLDADPSSYEFDRHLMRRIEKQNPRRFRRVSLISSTRV
ncbi:hypothetical protein D9615_002820 [Tricholomella constricta]|uniref:Uncharacterized protein n=1 Tax=Tricholomella constricta TaxID=117010 RepID=A0A8H5HFY1_9AGAR|nr:hypothetical protein D9615_002820 [Tricholomella constricta]